MFDGLIAFGHSLCELCRPAGDRAMLLSTLVGIVIGALPGLTATMGVALMTTLTLKMPSDQALLVLICIYVGAIYGGSRRAILLNIPGTPASAAACLDGYALAQQGLAGRAMGIATTGSVLGTLIGMFFLALFTPVLGEVALKFGAYEFFWLALFGVVISGNLTGNDPLKGWMAGFLGLFVAGHRPGGIYAYDRFTFGIRDLSGGFRLMPALVGAFGFAEVLMACAKEHGAGQDQSVRLGDPEAARRDAILAHHHPLRRDRHRSSASCRASARTWRPGRPMPRPSAPARRRRSSARARSTA